MKLKQANSYALHALMYMVRHATMLPITINSICKAERIPYRQLVKIFKQLSDAGIIKNENASGYTFDKSPSKISLLELFELIEGQPLFSDCFIKYCECNATPESCTVFASWKQATASIEKKLSQITIENAAWGHPEHYFDV